MIILPQCCQLELSLPGLNPEQSLSEQKASGLFDPTSYLYRNSVMFAGSVLLFAVLCGIVWEFTCNSKSKIKVASLETVQREMIRENLKRTVDEFIITFTKTIKMLRERHKAERWRLYKQQKKQKENETRRQEKERKEKGLKKKEDILLVIKQLKNR